MQDGANSRRRYVAKISSASAPEAQSDFACEWNSSVKDFSRLEHGGQHLQVIPNQFTSL